MSMFSESLRAFLKPVTPFLDDPDVSEILINGHREIWVERKGKLARTDAVFTEEGLLAAARNMAQYVGRPLTEERPRLDARLPDGSRIHVVLAPVARRGTTVSIRKFFAERLTIDRLVGFGSLTAKMARLLQAAVGLRLNIVVSGGTGSGKTSLLNVLSQFIAPDERILTIEDSAELQLTQPHLVSFESRPADRLGKGEVDIGDLLNSALRLRPDRIVVGEVRGGECFHLLQAMNTGHGGTLTTAHANTPVDTLRRLESLCLLSGIELPLRAVRAQVASAAHLVVCCERFGDGTRKVTHISEVLPLDEKGEYRTQDLVVYEQTSREADGSIHGRFVSPGVRPGFFARLAANGYGDIDEKFFEKGLVGDAEKEQEEAVARAAEQKTVAAEQKAVAAEQKAAGQKAAARPADAKPARDGSAPRLARPPEPVRSGEAPRAAGPRAQAPVTARTPAPPVRKTEAPREPESSIELDPDLQREVDARMPHESTLITRNPLERGREGLGDRGREGLGDRGREGPGDRPGESGDDTQPGTRRR